MPQPIELTKDKETYGIILGKVQRQLPFQIALKDFKRETYPGLDKAKAYSSDVIVHDGDIEWPAKIEMNAPLRYKGYTFFQSSFEQNDKGEMTVLSVVENRGRLFPYIGTFIIAAGLLLHILLAGRKKT
jgi:cytochrome c biogenesis protein ResB